LDLVPEEVEAEHALRDQVERDRRRERAPQEALELRQPCLGQELQGLVAVELHPRPGRRRSAWSRACQSCSLIPWRSAERKKARAPSLSRSSLPRSGGTFPASANRSSGSAPSSAARAAIAAADGAGSRAFSILLR